MSRMNNSNPEKIFDYVVMNGERMLLEQARVSIFTPAFLSSFGVYETIKVDQGCPFYLEEHLRRLIKSAQMIDINLNADVTTLVEWFNLLMELDRQATWQCRVLVLGAVQPDPNPVIAMRATPLPTYSQDLYQNGAEAILYEGQRALPTCKSLNMLVNYLAREKATRVGALEGLLHHNGHLTEGSRSNLFAVWQANLITPPESMVLQGITRDIISQVMQDTDHPVIEEPLSTDLSRYDELFISNTSMHVMPITKVNGQSIGNGQVGPVTKLTMSKFEAHYDQFMESLD